MNSTKIEQYNSAKREQSACQQWAALLGSPYRGGGGGIGELRSVRLAKGEGSPTIYHQASDGATNYHAMPLSLSAHMEEAIKANFGRLLADALARQGAALKDSAAGAVREHAYLLEAAGLVPLPPSIPAL